MKFKTIVEIRYRTTEKNETMPKGTTFDVNFVETFRNDAGNFETWVWIKDAKTIPALTVPELLYFCVRQAE